MGFLKRLFNWFFFGSTAPEGSSPEVLDVIESAPRRDEPAARPEPDFSLMRGTSFNLLDDLRSIRPLSEEFERAREELVTELRRLARPRPHNSKKVAR